MSNKTYRLSKTLNRDEWSKMRRDLLRFGWECEFTVLSGEDSGSLYTHFAGGQLHWGPQTPVIEIVQAIENVRHFYNPFSEKEAK